MYEVLDHNPREEDVLRFFRRFGKAVDDHGLIVRGVTTDGSPLYPGAVARVFSGACHQICRFHILADIVKGVIKAVSQTRRCLKQALPDIGRGRPRKGAGEALVRRRKRAEARIKELFDNRHLFVRRRLSVAQRRTFLRITRGRPRLRLLREIMEEVYRLFDRRCRMDTAVAKLARLRRRLGRLKDLSAALSKLLSPGVEKALTFLDDSMLPSTSNAVERGNRRHRKMQKSVYRVRTAAHISQRIAADMLREARANLRQQTTCSLHQQRTPLICPGSDATVSKIVLIFRGEGLRSGVRET